MFVFPSRTDTFGLVLLEAIASGLPVAAYPVPGSRDVVGATGAGVLSENLGEACLAALEMQPFEPAQVLKQFTWDSCADIFEDALAPINGTASESYQQVDQPQTVASGG